MLRVLWVSWHAELAWAHLILASAPLWLVLGNAHRIRYATWYPILQDEFSVKCAATGMLNTFAIVLEARPSANSGVVANVCYHATWRRAHRWPTVPDPPATRTKSRRCKDPPHRTVRAPAAPPPPRCRRRSTMWMGTGEGIGWEGGEGASAMLRRWHPPRSSLLPPSLAAQAAPLARRSPIVV